MSNELFIPIVTVLGMFLANAALIIPLFLWNRAESRADIRHMDTKLEAYRNETNEILKGIAQEMKDFHNRLCEIEAKEKS